MCAHFGFDFDGDGITSWEESYLTYKIGEDIINMQDKDPFATDDTGDDV